VSAVSSGFSLPSSASRYAHGVSKKSPTTAATVALVRLGIPFTAHPYDREGSDAGYGLEAAAALGVPPEQVFKSLVADVDGALVFAVVPVSGSLDLRALAAELGGKRAVLADPMIAERRTGYVVGGISPIGGRATLPVVLDSSADALSTIYVSGGRRGFDIGIAPADLLTATGGRSAPIAR
jgi:Cys-tRNA(Pro)/Cys-tRNA(Cys) deacylase